jgi:hypothetical protein
VWSNGERLYASGLRQGDDISLYTISALPVCHEKAVGNTWSHHVRAGVYVIRINNFTKTIAIKR